MSCQQHEKQLKRREKSEKKAAAVEEEKSRAADEKKENTERQTQKEEKRLRNVMESADNLGVCMCTLRQLPLQHPVVSPGQWL